ncbi:Ig-like domain-containing protein [Nocardioides conyzicola]|uniref:Bacterial Ig-like domain-containing protein n=1 Tax=Nocardioides conyzicola TaxID=1651781 RepID=A0ABP8WTE1_9ACTN
MSTAIRRRPARLALLTAAALAAGALGVLPASPADAAQTGPVPGTGTATWEVSQMLGIARDHLMAPQPDKFAAPATYSSPLTTWAGGTAGPVAADGSAELSVQGANYLLATDSGGWLRIADLGFEVEADGSGTVTADVTYGSGGLTATPTTQRVGTDLPIVDLSVDPGAPGGVEDAKYPTSYDALAYDFDATSTAYTWSNLRGRWSSQLLAFLQGDASADPAVPAFSFASLVANTVDGSGRIRYPAPFNLSIDRAVAATTASVGGETEAGVPIEVDGTGFKKTFPGVYVSLREHAEGDPAYAGGAVWADGPTNWVSNSAEDISPDPATGASAAIADDGSFETTLLLTPTMLTALDPTKQYSIVTRKGHGMGTIPSNADQITETPLDVSDLKEATTVAATTADSVRGTPASVDVTVTGEGTPDGTVTVKNAGTPVGDGTLVDGHATVTVSDLPVGTTALTVEYAGSAGYWSSTGGTSATVTKATSAVSTGGAASTTYGRTAVVTAAVPGAGTVTLTGLGATQSKTLTEAGTAGFTVPASLAAGSYTATFAYGGNADVAGSEATKAFSVAKASSRTVVKVAPKPTAKKAGKATVTVSGATAGSKVTVVIKGGGKTVKKAVKVNARGKVVVSVAKAPKGGSFTVTATYAGDANHKASAGKATYKVAKPKKK